MWIWMKFLTDSKSYKYIPTLWFCNFATSFFTLEIMDSHSLSVSSSSSSPTWKILHSATCFSILQRDFPFCNSIFFLQIGSPFLHLPLTTSTCILLSSILFILRFFLHHATTTPVFQQPFNNHQTETEAHKENRNRKTEEEEEKANWEESICTCLRQSLDSVRYHLASDFGYWFEWYTPPWPLLVIRRDCRCSATIVCSSATSSRVWQD